MRVFKPKTLRLLDEVAAPHFRSDAPGPQPVESLPFAQWGEQWDRQQDVNWCRQEHKSVSWPRRANPRIFPDNEAYDYLPLNWRDYACTFDGVDEFEHLYMDEINEVGDILECGADVVAPAQPSDFMRVGKTSALIHKGYDWMSKGWLRHGHCAAIRRNIKALIHGERNRVRHALKLEAA